MGLPGRIGPHTGINGVTGDGKGATQAPAAPPSTRKPGRRPKLSQQQRGEIVDAVMSKRCTAAEMARHHEVSEPTVSRILSAHRAGTKAAVADDGRGTEGPGVELIVGGLPVTALDQRIAIVGTSGSGKTYAAKGLVERLLDEGARVCVVDPLGVWWGLRDLADGGSPGPHPVVVFGGRHADVPLAPDMGAALGRLVGTHALACVVDVSDLGSAATRRAFMAAFTEALYGSNTEPLNLVLDEADLWAPQRVQADGYDLLGRVEEIVRRGRVRGFVPWLITQRPAVLHKDVLSQADILVSMKLTSSQDRAAIGRWIEGQADRGEGRRILSLLPQLARGEGWVWAPSDGVLAKAAFPPIQTLDSSRTPLRGERAAPARDLAAADLPGIRSALAQLAADAPGPHDALAAPGREQVMDLQLQLWARERELASASARVAELEVVMRRVEDHRQGGG